MLDFRRNIVLKQVNKAVNFNFQKTILRSVEMENSKLEKVKQFAKVFFNKIINELNDDLTNKSFSEFLKKKASSVPNEKKEIVYGGIVLNIIFAIEYVFKIDNTKKGLNNVGEIIKKLESKKSETDKMLSLIIRTEAEMTLSCENCLAIFSTNDFHSFVDLLEIEMKVNLKETMSEMLSGIIVSFLETHNKCLVLETFQEPPPFVDFLVKNTSLN